MDRALLTAIGAVIVALIAWLKTRDNTETASRNARELAQLKASLDSSETRLRHDLGRDMAAHESRLRIDAEIRLRMFDRATRAIGQVTAVLRFEYEHAGALSLLATDMAFGGSSDDKTLPVQERWPRADGARAFMPPELHDVLESSVERISKARVALEEMIFMTPDKTRGSGEAGATKARELLRVIEETLRVFEVATQSWTRKQWETLGALSAIVKGSTDASNSEG